MTIKTIKVSARMAHWGIRLVAVGVALGFGGFAQPAAEAACNLMCVQGDNGCAANQHYAYVSEITGSLSGEPHWACIENECHDVHLPCAAAVPADDLDVLEHAAIAPDRAKVQSILNEYPSSLTVNIERSALQQLDCGGNVVVHIPVPSTLMIDLAEGRH